MKGPDAAYLDEIAEVLVATARGEFGARATRTHTGDSWDVLAFLVNQTTEEVERLVSEVKQDREELSRTRLKLIQAEKLAALGELAGGVAHELNQPLTVMQTLAEHLLERPEMSIESRRSELQLIFAAARRMGRIVSAIRTFGRQAPLRQRPIHARDPLRSALSLLSEPLSEARIEVTVHESGDLPTILGDSEALEQVFINLLSNARDVLEELPQGKRRAVCITLCPAEESLRVHFDDSGPGIPEQVQSRIFDPFFTTKTVGKGTGLGLSISHGIVREHGGELSYKDLPGGGARFTLEIPAAGAE